MFKKPQRGDPLVLAADEGTADFATADLLFAMEWSTVAPGFGGWEVLVDDEKRTRLVSVVPPGSEVPTFFAFWKGRDIVVVWRRPGGESKITEVGRFTNLRAAVLKLCPLHEESVQHINETMETLYPRDR